jgi:hypothetical protein
LELAWSPASNHRRTGVQSLVHGAAHAIRKVRGVEGGVIPGLVVPSAPTQMTGLVGMESTVAVGDDPTTVSLLSLAFVDSSRNGRHDGWKRGRRDWAQKVIGPIARGGIEGIGTDQRNNQNTWGQTRGQHGDGWWLSRVPIRYFITSSSSSRSVMRCRMVFNLSASPTPLESEWALAAEGFPAFDAFQLPSSTTAL